MKRIRQILILLPILILAAHAAFAQFSLNRDLSKFDDGGVYEFNISTSQERQNEMRARIREFLWDHWKVKRRAHVQITFWSPAEDPSTYDLFIERAKNGAWGVTSEYKRQCCIEQTRQHPEIGIEFNTGTLYYGRLERREAIPGIKLTGDNFALDSHLFGKAVPINAKRTGREFILLFRHEKQGQPDLLF